MSTTITRPADVERGWYVIDATDQTLGRLATRIATVLRGKHKPTFQSHVDTGDYVVVVNADKVNLTGNKLDQKFYYNYSGYAGGLRARSARELLETYPDRVLTHAVKGMLPKNRLARQVLSKLKVYGGAEHPHAAQKPQPFPAYV
ncbi:MAG: 50S ribosomal protein L13 [Myxococcota bacterium]|nr:50S ribosomal protein L13 [Myxococcota bacterium]MEC8422824.1 50S ribosomal protein L13 [Myxococcota bacterium]